MHLWLVMFDDKHRQRCTYGLNFSFSLTIKGSYWIMLFIEPQLQFGVKSWSRSGNCCWLLVFPCVVGPRGCALCVSSCSIGSTLSSTNGNAVHFKWLSVNRSPKEAVKFGNKYCSQISYVEMNSQCHYDE